jgi:hypothetical protein
MKDMIKELHKAKMKLAEKYGYNIIEIISGGGYVFNASSEFLAELNTLLEKQKEIDLKFAQWHGFNCIEIHGQYGKTDVPEEVLSMTDMNDIYDYWLKNVTDE